MSKVSVSILDCDFQNLDSEINKINKSISDYIHIDIMDGSFVKRNTKSLFDINKIKSLSKIPLDIHLMVDNPLDEIEVYSKMNPEIISFHIENNENVEKCIELIKSKNSLVGLAINPDTELSTITPYLNYIDIILVMSVYPGKGGQNFIEDTYEKIQQLEKLKEEKKFKISVDGGVNNTNSTNLKISGADILVSGSFLIKSSNLNNAIKSL
tara:strand:+ start:3158 stop:3790 length:633 start_codon:yes stop_codon:yes gene_type:complete